jgi:hypothetical protein
MPLDDGERFSIAAIEHIAIDTALSRSRKPALRPFHRTRLYCRTFAREFAFAEVNWYVLAVVGALSMVPALKSTRVDLMPALKESRTAGARLLWLSRALMVMQIAISMVILLAAGLFVQTLSSQDLIQMGFQSRKRAHLQAQPR